MKNLKLYIGDKNLSSWSLRSWLALKISDLPFDEIMICLDQSDTQAKLVQASPSGRVPCLVDGNTKIWDSLAICEYVAELAPEKNLWPVEPQQRALARSLVAEMHSGFESLRNQLSMDIRLSIEIRHLTEQTICDIQRILELWTMALKQSGGPFLFGKFCIADAFFAPVVFRFKSYGITTEAKLINDYRAAVEEFPAVVEWARAALKEAPPKLRF
jgi:glutathione S-transferase